MARPTIALLSMLLLASAGWAQSPAPPPNPWQVIVEPEPTPGFDLSTGVTQSTSAGGPGSRIVADTEVLDDGTFGFGMFGHKAERSAHSPATARDFGMPRDRKPAVGFSLKF
jgi:hypothetical protein